MLWNHVVAQDLHRPSSVFFCCEEAEEKERQAQLQQRVDSQAAAPNIKSDMADGKLWNDKLTRLSLKTSSFQLNSSSGHGALDCQVTKLRHHNSCR